MRVAAVERELLVSGDAEKVDARAAPSQVEHEVDRRERARAFHHEVGPARDGFVDLLFDIARLRIERIGCAQLHGVLQRVLRRVDGDQPARAGLVRHQAQEADPARADDDHVLADLHLGILDDALPRAAQRFRDGRRRPGDVLRFVVEIGLFGHHVLGETTGQNAVGAVAARREAVLAVVKETEPAGLAYAAVTARRDDHFVAGPERFDHRADLMAEDGGEDDVAPLAAHGLPIRGADAGGLHPDHRLCRAGRRLRHVFEDKFVVVVQDGGEHVRLLTIVCTRRAIAGAFQGPRTARPRRLAGTSLPASRRRPGERCRRPRSGP